MVCMLPCILFELPTGFRRKLTFFFPMHRNTNAPDGYNTDLPVYIKLGYDTGDSLHEYWDLVSDKDNIPIGKGHTIATLPADLQKRDDYVVIVFGDSGNASQKFKIVPKPGNKRDELVERIVYNPTITAPTSGQSFPAGSKTTVTWSVDGLPDSLKDSKVEIRLGYAPSKDDPGYHEKWELGHFPIQDAKAEVTLPSDLEPRSDYLFVVLGDSGNFSPHFTVTKN